LSKNAKIIFLSEIYRGFKFGLLLQIAIGPVCFFIFQLGAMNNFLVGMSGVLAAVLMDSLFVFGAIKGMAVLLESKKTQATLKYLGCLILILFGMSTVLTQFDINFLPVFNIQNSIGSQNAFLKTALITISNPLTIIFWAGVFSTKIAEENMRKQEAYYFGTGAILATLCFLSSIAFMGSLSMSFLPDQMIKILNIFVGLILIYFGTKIFLKK